MELRVGGKYRLGRRIGSGSFGDIYLGKQPMCRSSCKCDTIRYLFCVKTYPVHVYELFYCCLRWRLVCGCHNSGVKQNEIMFLYRILALL